MQKIMDKKYGLFINGEWLDAKEGKTFNAYCPANGELLSTCAEAGKEDIDLAFKAAKKAFEDWKNISVKERSSLLLKAADLIEKNINKIAMIDTLDVGRPIKESLSNVSSVIDQFRYFAGVIRAEDDLATMIDRNTMRIVLSEPLGVVGLIVPWNFPLSIAAWKIVPALSAGNTIVIKPSSLASLGILELTKILNEVLPPGVFNVITGSGSTTGNYFLQHPDISKLSFTGSTEIGYIIADAAAKKLIPVTLELGGKSANIFFPDCPWDKAVEGVPLGILRNQGQVCAAGSRAFVHEDIYDKFLSEVIKLFEKVKVGLPWEKDTTMGSLISEAQLNKVLNYIEIGKQEGARIITGGHRITKNGLDKGFFVEPTIFIDVDNKMRIAQEEIFGPVLCVIKFKTEKEVIDMANDSIYGLSGAVWTKDINRALRVARELKTGKIGINVFSGSPAHSPFGGYKKSGFGRENHKIALEHYVQKKTIFISLSENKLGIYQ